MARAARALRWSDLASHRQACARRSAADFVACTFAGGQLPEVKPALLLASAGDTFMPGFSQGFTPGGAALAAGTAGALLQLHDAFPEGGNHPSSAVIPAVLALRSRSRISMNDALTALVAGYETANRIALSGFPAQQRAGVTPTAVAGAIGAAAAAGLMLELDEAQLSAAISLATLFGPATPFQALIEHADATPLHGGLAARAGVEAALLAQAGATVGAHVLEGRQDAPGWLAMLHGNPASLAPECWDGSTMDSVIWKLFPACFSCQASIEAVLRAPTAEAGDIAAVEINLPSGAMALVGGGPSPHAELYDCLMSVRWTTASALVHGAYGVQFAQTRLDPDVAALVARTMVNACIDLDNLPEGIVGAQVRITLTDGSTRTIRHLRPLHGAPPDKGPTGWCADPDDPALDRKIGELTGHAMSLDDALTEFDRSATA